MATRQRVLRALQNSRSRHILALVPEENATSEVSGESSFENEAEVFSHYERHESESSEAPSISSSLAGLNILDSSDDAQNLNVSGSILADFNPEENNDKEQQHPCYDILPSISSLPTLSPMSNLPSVTTSFILNQVSDSPQQSPQNLASTPQSTRSTRAQRRRHNTANLTGSRQPRRVPKKKIELKFKWSYDRFQHRAELDPDTFESPLPDRKNAFNYFTDFFSEDLFDEICLSTNMYSLQTTGRSINLTVDELRSFLAIKVIMGIVSMPSYLDYWSINTRFSLVADVMPLKRYQLIRRYLHFVDNNKTNSDPYFKIRPVIEKIRQNCLKIEEETRFSIDEMVIPYKGTKAGKKRQYNPRKPRKWGFKNFVRAGASGIIYDFFLYAGNDMFVECSFTEEEEGLGWGAKAVLRLCKTIKKKPCIVYFDNFFSSLELIYHLRNTYGIFSLGTMRTNRLRSATSKLKSDKDLKSLGRGSFSQTVCNKTKLSLLKWNDNKCVILASSYADAYPTTKVKRYCKINKRKIDVDYPNIVKHYNAHMGGVDLADMLIALYRTEMKSRRWYLSIFSQLLDICVNNAWLMYRRDSTRKRIKKVKTLKEFRLEIYRALLQKGKNVDTTTIKDLIPEEKIKNPKRPRPVDDIKYDNVDHFPEHGKEYGRCAYCKKGFTTVYCIKCNVRLCFVKDRNCHFNYHHN
ncbi:unnamed protein product, partial [Brenthis ino]